MILHFSPWSNTKNCLTATNWADPEAENYEGHFHREPPALTSHELLWNSAARPSKAQFGSLPSSVQSFPGTRISLRAKAMRQHISLFVC